MLDTHPSSLESECNNMFTLNYLSIIDPVEAMEAYVWCFNVYFSL